MALQNEDSASDSYHSHDKKLSPKDISPRPFYGDLVVAAAFTAVVPVAFILAFTTCKNDPEKRHIAVLAVTFCVLYCGLSYLQNSDFYSFCAFLAGLW